MAEKKRNKAGASAKAEFEKRSKKREEKVTKMHPKIGKFLLKAISPAQSTKAWDQGAVGEEYIGGLLEKYCEEHGFDVLHDLAVPKSKANIDHILITSFGVFVVDSKNYRGLVELRDNGKFFSAYKEELYVGGRKQSILVEKMKKQVELVKAAVPSFVPVHGILAFYAADFPLLFKPKELDGILINSKGVTHILDNFPRNKEIDVQITVKKIQKT